MAHTYSDQWPQWECAQIACSDVDQQAVATDGGHTCPGGTPSQCPERQGLVCGVWTVVALPFACDLTMVPRFLGTTHFLQLAFPASEPLTPVLSVVSVKPTVILSQDPLS